MDLRDFWRDSVGSLKCFSCVSWNNGFNAWKYNVERHCSNYFCGCIEILVDFDFDFLVPKPNFPYLTCLSLDFGSETSPTPIFSLKMWKNTQGRNILKWPLILHTISLGQPCGARNATLGNCVWMQRKFVCVRLRPALHRCPHLGGAKFQDFSRLSKRFPGVFLHFPWFVL